jgi:arylsulfatase
MTSIALVVLDTLRKDYFDEYFDWLPGRRFERTYSTGNWTVPAHASLFTGLYASEVGVHAKSLYFDCENLSIAEHLSRVGYQTRAISANPNVSPWFDFDRGFEEFYSLTTPDFLNNYDSENIFNWSKFSRNSSRTGLSKYIEGVYRCVWSDAKTIPSIRLGIHRARSNNDDAVKYGGGIETLDLLDSLSFGDDEFLFLNLMEPHEPYETPSEYREDSPPLTHSVGDLKLNGEVPAEEVREAYEACVQYTSDIYRKIFDKIQEDFDYIITLSDHGELLGEGNAWAHEHGLRPELIHVPLCISHDNITGEYTATTSLLDVHQTIAMLTGLDINSRGRDLLDSTNSTSTGEYLSEYHGLTPWSENRVRENCNESIFQAYDKDRFAYIGDVYAYETNDGIQFKNDRGNIEQDTVINRLEHLKRNRNIRSAENNTDIPDEITEQLSDLGYA